MKIEEISQVFKALSDTTRLQIVYLLIDKESMCVCDIVDKLQLTQSTTSRHLAYLKNSNLVSAQRKGVWMHYSLQKEALEFVKLNNLAKQLDELIELKNTTDKQCCNAI